MRTTISFGLIWFFLAFASAGNSFLPSFESGGYGQGQKYSAKDYLDKSFGDYRKTFNEGSKIFKGKNHEGESHFGDALQKQRSDFAGHGGYDQYNYNKGIYERNTGSGYEKAWGWDRTKIITDIAGKKRHFGAQHGEEDGLKKKQYGVQSKYSLASHGDKSHMAGNNQERYGKLQEEHQKGGEHFEKSYKLKQDPQIYGDIGYGQSFEGPQGNGFFGQPSQRSGGQQGRGFGGQQGRGFGLQQGRGFGLQQGRGFGLQQGRGFGLQQSRGFGLQQGRDFEGQKDRGFEGQQDRGFEGQQDRGFEGQQDRGFKGQQDQGLVQQGQSQRVFVDPEQNQGRYQGVGAFGDLDQGGYSNSETREKRVKYNRKPSSPLNNYDNEEANGEETSESREGLSGSEYESRLKFKRDSTSRPKEETKSDDAELKDDYASMLKYKRVDSSTASKEKTQDSEKKQDGPSEDDEDSTTTTEAAPKALALKRTRRPLGRKLTVTKRRSLYGVEKSIIKRYNSGLPGFGDKIKRLLKTNQNSLSRKNEESFFNPGKLGKNVKNGKKKYHSGLEGFGATVVKAINTKREPDTLNVQIPSETSRIIPNVAAVFTESAPINVGSGSSNSGVLFPSTGNTVRG